MTPPLRTWQRIIYELERLGGYAPQYKVLRAAGYAMGTTDPYALCVATYEDGRLYEDVVEEPTLFDTHGGTRFTSNLRKNTLYLGLLGWPGTHWRAPAGCDCPACRAMDGTCRASVWYNGGTAVAADQTIAAPGRAGARADDCPATPPAPTLPGADCVRGR